VTTAVDLGTVDLTLVSDRVDQCCELVTPPCSNEAVRRLIFDGPKGWKPEDDPCGCRRRLNSCLRCMDLASQSDMLVICRKCKRFMELRSAEAIRR